MLSLRYPPAIVTRSLELNVSRSLNGNGFVVCSLKGPRPRYPRVWKSRKRIGTISKSAKLIECIKGLSNVKEEVYGALDSFVAWELEFPLITVKKALKTLEREKEWKRLIQVTKWMLSKGQGKTKGSYYTLLNALAEDGRLEEAEELWAMIFSENLENLPREFFSKMISIYYNKGMHEKMFEVFADMEELGIKPNSSIVEMLGKVFQDLGMMDKYEKLMKKYPPTVWEYRYFKGKRVRVQSKHPKGLDEEADPKVPQWEHSNGIEDAEASGRVLKSEDQTGVEEPNAQVPPTQHRNGVDEEANKSLPELMHQNKAVGEEANANIPQ
eukprot:TRINITY_DN1430_c0_g1_i5.p1 TRINITY_DN1430_c0_g1~~TRINITY_DN1430_c0_g1_i5.p1  ORF type:complete len:326 (+),score=73.58 TRINITY_DN1430_c0_g1_i5:291-1268(+)